MKVLILIISAKVQGAYRRLSMFIDGIAKVVVKLRLYTLCTPLAFTLIIAGKSPESVRSIRRLLKTWGSRLSWVTWTCCIDERGWSAVRCGRIKKILLRDDDIGIVEACVRLLKDDGLCARLGEAARRKAKSMYDGPAIGDSIASELRAIFSSGNTSSARVSALLE
jgi:hypothetical protein